MENMNITDIIKNAYENKPTGVEDAFNNVIQQKMADAIETRRQEIAHSMYNGSESDDADVEPDVDDTDYNNLDNEESTDEDV